jgi:Domain of unknown function (DUF4282)
MAGQPPEPSFQPSGQDQNLTQGRPAWQPTAYPPPVGGGQPGYSTPPSYTPADQGYGSQDQGYGAQDQTYTVGQGGAQAQAQPQPPSPDYAGYQGYQAPGYGAQGQPGQGQAGGMPQWQGISGVTPGQPRQRGEKGFLGSLFDFSFSSFVTPKIIKVLYVLLALWTGLVAIFILIIGFRTGGVGGGLVTLIIVEPIFVLLTLGIYRVVLEAFMVIFRIYEELKQVRANTAAGTASTSSVD